MFDASVKNVLLTTLLAVFYGSNQINHEKVQREETSPWDDLRAGRLEVVTRLTYEIAIDRTQCEIGVWFGNGLIFGDERF